MALILLRLVLGAVSAEATTPADGWLLGPGATARFLGASEAGGGRIAASQARLFGLAELPMQAVQAGWTATGWAGRPVLEAGWEQIGDPLFRQQTTSLHLQSGRRVRMGLFFTQVVVAAVSHAERRLPAQSAWAAFVTAEVGRRVGPPPDGAELSCRLWLPVYEAHRASALPARHPLLQVQGWGRYVAGAARVEFGPDRGPRVALEFAVGGQAGAAAGLQVTPQTGAIGPVFFWRRGRVHLATSHLAHPQLGLTHRFRLGLGAWGSAGW